MFKKIIIGIVVVILLIALAGFLKFNFTNGDIYIQQEDGTVIQYDDLTENK